LRLFPIKTREKPYNYTALRQDIRYNGILTQPPERAAEADSHTHPSTSTTPAACTAITTASVLGIMVIVVIIDTAAVVGVG